MLSQGTLFLLGLLSSTAFAPLFWMPFLIMGFLGLSLYLRQCKNYSQAFWGGYSFSFGHFLTGLYWISASLWIDIGKFWVWVVPCLLILPFYFSFIGGAVGVFIYTFVSNQSNFYHLFWLGFLWIIGEMLRVHSWIPLPWNLVSYSFGKVPALMQGTAVIGPFGLGMLTFLMAALIDTLVFWRHRLLIDKCFSAIFIGILAFMYQWGHCRYHQGDDFPSSNFLVRVVQPNIDQTIKWNPKVFRKNLETYLQLSCNKRPKNVQCIIWPETVLIDLQIYDKRYASAIQKIIPPQGFLLLGVQRFYRFANKTIYNSLFVLNNNLHVVQSYDKNHLVPFGEYIPLRKTFEDLNLNVADISQSTLDITKGTAHSVITWGNIPPFNPLICYEAIFPHYQLTTRLPCPQWIVNLTNDAWFGDTSGPYQHLVACQFRAIEQGIPVVRAANTGISAVINAKGKIVQSLKLNTQGYIDTFIPGWCIVPLYQQYGESVFAIFACVFLGLFLLLSKKIKKGRFF